MTGRFAAVALAAAIAVVPLTAFSGSLRWIINGPALHDFASDASARHYLAGARPFVVIRKNAPVVLPPEWDAQEVRSFTAVGALDRASVAGLGPNVRAVLYDNERWKFTPKQEQRDPAAFTAQAARIAHSRGLLLIAAPAVDLVRVLAPDARGRVYDRFLSLGVLAGVAKTADVVVIQAQGSETALPLYSNFVQRGAQQARTANPHVVVLAGISTNPSGQRVTAEQIVAAIRATRASVDGYWFNVPAPGPYCPRCNDFRPDIAIDVFSALKSDGL